MSDATDKSRPQAVSLPEPLGKVRDAVDLLAKATTEQLSQIIPYLKKVQRDRVEKLRIDYECAVKTLGFSESRSSTILSEKETSVSGNANGDSTLSRSLPEPIGLVDDVVRLFKDVDNEQLVQIRGHLGNVLLQKKGAADRECKSLDDALNLLNPKSGSSKTNSEHKTTRTNAKAKQPKAKANGGTRAPRGESTGAILAFLKDGSKTKKQIDEHFKEKGLEASSAPALLNRLKNAGKIIYNKESKLYSLPSEADNKASQ